MIDITNATNDALNTLLGLDGDAILADMKAGQDVDLDEETLELFTSSQMSELGAYLEEIGAGLDYILRVTETWTKARGLDMGERFGDGSGYEAAILSRQERELHPELNI